MQSNAFWKSSGLSRHIPFLYNYYYNQLRDALQGKGNSESSSHMTRNVFLEYDRPGHSFHAKGIFAFGPDYHLCSIGSSNLSCRSMYRDLELQAYLRIPIGKTYCVDHQLKGMIGDRTIDVHPDCHSMNKQKSSESMTTSADYTSIHPLKHDGTIIADNLNSILAWCRPATFHSVSPFHRLIAPLLRTFF